MGDNSEDEAEEFSERYNKALLSAKDKLHADVIHELVGETPPPCCLGPHFPDGMPKTITKVLDQYQIDNSIHFADRDWSSWGPAKPQGWPTLTDEWRAWVPRMEYFFADQWRQLCIYEAIKLTEQDIVVEKPILAAALCFWSSATNTMNLPLGYMSPTILDVCTLIGLPSIGAEISANHRFPTDFMDSMLPPKLHDKDDQKEAMNKSKRSRNYSTLYKNYAEVDSGPLDRKPVKEDEHAAFLFYWLCKYMFCCKSGQCPRDYAALAEALATGTKLALGPFVLAHLYRCLHDIVTNQMNPDAGGPLWIFQLWLRAYFPQLSTPGPNQVYDGALGRQLLVVPSSHMSFENCFKMFYTLRSLDDFSICYYEWDPSPSAQGSGDQAVPEAAMRDIWGCFLIARDLHYGLTISGKRKPGVEVYLPNYFARQFGLMQSCPVPFQHSENRLCSWRRMFKSKSMCSSVSKRYRQYFNSFNMKIFQTSSRPTPLFAIWWLTYSRKFVDAELMDIFKCRLINGIADGPERQSVQKRARLDQTVNDSDVMGRLKLTMPRQEASAVGDSEGPSASKRQKEVFVVEISPTNSANSDRTMELLIEDDQEVVEDRFTCVDATSPEDSAQSLPKDDEIYTDEIPEHEPPIFQQTTPILPKKTPIPETSGAHILTADALALLDALDHQTKPEPKRVDNEETKAAIDLVDTLCRSSLLGVVTDGLYSRFKEAVGVLISAHHFSPERVRQIEDHLGTMDINVPAYANALKRWDDGRSLERKYGPIVERQSSRATKLTELRRELTKDAQELAELEKQANVIRGRMAEATTTINQEYGEHHHELKLFSTYANDTLEFLAVKDYLDRAMTKYNDDWAVWETILL